MNHGNMPKKAYVFTKPCKGCGEEQRMTYLLNDKMALMLAEHFQDNGISCVPCATKKRAEAEKQVAADKAAIESAKISIPPRPQDQEGQGTNPDLAQLPPPEPTPEAPLA